MADRHNKSFFGQKTGMILDSDKKEQPHIFLTFIKKQLDNNWEKFKEGKTIRFSLEELINILEVLKENLNEWKTMHTFEKDSTNIEVQWEKGTRKAVSFRAGAYKKMLYGAEIILMELLLMHILGEKIEFSTVMNFDKSKSKVGGKPHSEGLFMVEEQVKNNQIVSSADIQTESMEIKGKIKSETEKALCIDFGHKDVWVPKSTIKNQFEPTVGLDQSFLIDTWILKKNAVLT